MWKPEIQEFFGIAIDFLGISQNLLKFHIFRDDTFIFYDTVIFSVVFRFFCRKSFLYFVAYFFLFNILLCRKISFVDFLGNFFGRFFWLIFLVELFYPNIFIYSIICFGIFSYGISQQSATSGVEKKLAPFCDFYFSPSIQVWIPRYLFKVWKKSPYNKNFCYFLGSRGVLIFGRNELRIQTEFGPWENPQSKWKAVSKVRKSWDKWNK